MTLIFFLVTPFVLFCTGIITWIIAHIIKNEKLAFVCKCLLSWLTLFFLFPSIAKKAGFVKQLWKGWILALLAPPMLALYLLIYGLATINSQLPYEELLFTSPDDIAAITEIPNFPKYEYKDNVHNGWDGITYSRNLFKDEEEVVRLFEIIEDKLDDDGNVYWNKISLSSIKDKEFFGCEEIYICDRGWDSLYVTRPANIDVYDVQVRIAIGKKGFTVNPSPCYAWGLGTYANPDKLSQLTGVKFPNYQMASCSYVDMFVDQACDVTLLLEDMPSILFIKSLEKANQWKKQEDGTYMYTHVIGSSKEYETVIVVNPKSKLIKIKDGTY